MTKKKMALKLLVLMLVLASILVSCTNDTKYPGTMNVVEATQALVEPGVVVIDARGEEAYNKGHLEGAVCVSPTELVVETPTPMTLASKAQIEAVLSSKGISNDDTIYVYDDNGGVSAGRIWWTLKVYGHDQVMIVNGGANAIVAAKLPLTTEKTVREATTYTASEAKTDWIASYEEVLAVTENPDSEVILLDVRSLAEYEEGYIKGAKLYPHTQNLYKDGTFMSSRDLRLFYKDFGIDLDDTVIVYCKSSFRATQTVALLQEAGYKNLKVYDGAWLEWEVLQGGGTPVEEEAPVGGSDGS